MCGVLGLAFFALLSGTSATGDWRSISHYETVDIDMDVESFEYQAQQGEGIQMSWLKLDLLNESGHKMAGWYMYPYLHFKECSSRWFNYDLPTDATLIWTFARYPNSFVVKCNDIVISQVVFADIEKEKYPKCEEIVNSISALRLTSSHSETEKYRLGECPLEPEIKPTDPKRWFAVMKNTNLPINMDVQSFQYRSEKKKNMAWVDLDLLDENKQKLADFYVYPYLRFQHCDDDWITYDVPSNGTLAWTITRYETSFVVRINGVVISQLVFAEIDKEKYPKCEEVMKKIKFISIGGAQSKTEAYRLGEVLPGYYLRGRYPEDVRLGGILAEPAITVKSADRWFAVRKYKRISVNLDEESFEYRAEKREGKNLNWVDLDLLDKNSKHMADVYMYPYLHFKPCTDDWLTYELPAGNTLVWTFTRYPSSFVVRCNGVVLSQIVYDQVDKVKFPQCEEMMKNVTMVKVSGAPSKTEEYSMGEIIPGYHMRARHLDQYRLGKLLQEPAIKTKDPDEWLEPKFNNHVEIDLTTESFQYRTDTYGELKLTWVFFVFFDESGEEITKSYMWPHGRNGYEEFTEFWLHHCDENYTYMKNIPKDDVRIWTFTRTPTAFTIRCNGKIVYTLIFSQVDRTKYPKCEEITEDIREIQIFGQYSTTDRYRVKVVDFEEEDEAEEKEEQEDERLVNVARGGIATQDSTLSGNVATLAIDGNYANSSYTHSSDLTDTWWEVKLAEQVAVEKVVVYYSIHLQQERTNNIQVYVDYFKCGTIALNSKQNRYELQCGDASGVVGKKVRIVGQDGEYLSLCEVEVLADSSKSPSKLVNLANKKPTQQSSTRYGRESRRAVDGSDSVSHPSTECTFTDGAGWWEVDLKNRYIVQSVAIVNRQDSYRNLIDGAQVYVGGVLCGKVNYNAMELSYVIQCGAGVVGNKVRIVNEKASVSLCEVHVNGEDKIIGDEPDKEELGEKSGDNAGDVSVAQCDAGYVVKECEAMEDSVTKGSQGVHIDESGSKCIAQNTGNGKPVQAKALCTLNDQKKNPCNGLNLLKYRNFFSNGSNPKVQCPKGYAQTVCHADSKQGLSGNDSICQQSGCASCVVSNVCELMEDKAYKDALCGSCESYTCGEEQECQMSGSNPTCVKRKSPCENNDRCGSKGKCVVSGKTSYKCECGDGDEYSKETGSCLPAHTAWKKVYGDDAFGDDAKSIAECPGGMSVMRCHSYGVPTATDGVYINQRESECIAYASHRKLYGVKAVAYCGYRRRVVDQCTQDYIYSTEYRYDTGLSPSVTCPDGYVMSSCVFHSHSTQLMTEAAKALVEGIGSVKVGEDGVCSVPDCLGTTADKNRMCRLSAVCNKLTGNEYIKEACPTCDRVRCPKDHTCEIVEGLPQCVEHVKGPCEEVDQCGNAGTCIEQGTNYTCTCNTGYLFDGSTCRDVDECAEDPCGNGECTNSEGSYSCTCMKGFVYKRGTCMDVDECKSNPCGSNQRCSNTEGSYICDCLDTFYRDDSGKCVCAEGFEARNQKCQDINECKFNPCKENEDCTNTIGNYECSCFEGFERGPTGFCKDYTPQDCGVYPEREVYATYNGKNIRVKLKGELKKDFKKYAEITWTKDDEIWNPSLDGKERFNGFTIWNFRSDDTGTYKGSIYIEKPNNENYKCSITFSMKLLEGSVKMDINRREWLENTILKVGKGIAIRCQVSLKNVNLENPNDPNNVNWYRVYPGKADHLIDEGDRSEIQINKKGGTYRLWFVKPQKYHSGTYKCEFDKYNIRASTSVGIKFE